MVRRHRVEDTRRIDIRSLVRLGRISKGAEYLALGPYAVEIERREQPVIGGVRLYMRCPQCSRRVEILFVRETLACRQCHRLAYTIENRSKRQRRIATLLKRRRRLEPSASAIMGTVPEKPKSMH